MYVYNSTVDWCEKNFAMYDNIAEFWNTITGLAIVFSTVLFQYNNSTIISTFSSKHYFSNVHKSLLVVGVGTMLFHSTLLYVYQLLDELPMLLVALQYTKLLLSLETTQTVFDITRLQQIQKVVNHVNTMLMVIPFTYFVHPKLQIMSFHVTLKVMEGTLIYMLYTISRNFNRIFYLHVFDKYKNETVMKLEDIRHKQVSYIKNQYAYMNIKKETDAFFMAKSDISRYTRIGVLFYSSSVVLWTIENLFCDQVEWLQLHAVWHVLSSVGIYQLNQIMKTHAVMDYILYKRKFE